MIKPAGKESSKSFAMTKKIRVGVKFCGNCNPQISTGEVFARIKEEAGQKLASVEFVHWESSPYDLLLIISGCPVDCAGRPAGVMKEITVAGESVNLSACNADGISSEVIKTLRVALPITR